MAQRAGPGAAAAAAVWYARQSLIGQARAGDPGALAELQRLRPASTKVRPKVHRYPPKVR